MTNAEKSQIVLRFLRGESVAHLGTSFHELSFVVEATIREGFQQTLELMKTKGPRIHGE